MNYEDPRFERLICLNVQLTKTSPADPGYEDLLQETMKLALELYLEYDEEKLLTISVYQK